MGEFIDYQDTDDAYEKIFVLFWDYFFFFDKVIVKAVKDLYNWNCKIVKAKAYLC